MSSQKIILIGLVVVLLFGGILYVNRSKQVTNQIEIKPTETQSVTKITSEPAVKEITMTAKQFEFDPATITVKKGEKVRLKIKSVDVEHGFALSDFGIDVKLQPGKEETVEFTPDKTGEFEFHCSVMCGTGHREMKGKLIVE